MKRSNDTHVSTSMKQIKEVKIPVRKQMNITEAIRMI